MNELSRVILYCGPAYDLPDSVIDALPNYIRKRAKKRPCSDCGKPCRYISNVCKECRRKLRVDKKKPAD